MPNPTYDKMKNLLKDIEQAIREEERANSGFQNINEKALAYIKIRKAFRNAYPKGL